MPKGNGSYAFLVLEVGSRFLFDKAGREDMGWKDCGEDMGWKEGSASSSRRQRLKKKLQAVQE